MAILSPELDAMLSILDQMQHFIPKHWATVEKDDSSQEANIKRFFKELSKNIQRGTRKVEDLQIARQGIYAYDQDNRI